MTTLLWIVLAGVLMSTISRLSSITLVLRTDILSELSQPLVARCSLHPPPRIALWACRSRESGTLGLKARCLYLNAAGQIGKLSLDDFE